MWSAMLASSEGPSYCELLGDGTPIRIRRELARALVGRSPYTWPSLGLAVLEQIPKLFGTGTGDMVAEGRRLRDRLGARLGDRAVMLYPTYPCSAPRHRAPVLRTFHWVYTAIVNVLELPSTHVPMGLDERGLPVGVQVIGGPGMDHITIAVAQALEEAAGGWVPPWQAG